MSVTKKTVVADYLREALSRGDYRPGDRLPGEEELAEWESYGLIGPLPEGDYDARAVRVAALVAELGRSGIEPRHLRAMKAAADREASLVEQIVAPLRLHRNPQTRAHAQERTKELAELTTSLHSALFQSALGVRLP